MIVVGGGVAGIAASVILSEYGFSVELLERSNRLGGRASSFFDKRVGEELDTGQHAILGCCTNVVDLYSRLGALQYIRFSESLAFADRGTLHTLRLSPLPEPFHLMPSFMNFGLISLKDRLRTASLALHSLSPERDNEISVRDRLMEIGQSERSVLDFWSPVLMAALNERLELASERYASMVIRQAMLVDREGFRMGVPSVPLSVLHQELPLKLWMNRDVSVHLNAPVIHTDVKAGNTEVRTTDGRRFNGEYLVLATGSRHRHLFPTASGFDTDAPVETETAQIPIVTLYIWLPTNVSMPPTVCIGGSNFHWCFSRDALCFGDKCIRVAMVASGADRLMGKSATEITNLGLTELSEATRTEISQPLKSRVVKHRFATFSPSIGCEDIRPVQHTRLSNLFIAGDWTSTGWPGTMESAVRSGYICARKILAQEGIECSVPVPDLHPKGLMRYLRNLNSRNVVD